MAQTKRRSAGARQLASLGLTDTDIATRLDVKQPQVSYWKTGVRVPQTPARKRMHAEFGIPPESWDADVIESGGRVVRGRSAAAPVEVTGAPIDYEPVKVAPREQTSPVSVALSVASQAEELRSMVREIIDAIKADAGATPLERLRYASEGHRLLDRLGRLTGESLLVAETRIVRLPAFRNIVDRITVALRKWPEAQAAVADELEAMGGR